MSAKAHKYGLSGSYPLNNFRTILAKKYLPYLSSVMITTEEKKVEKAMDKVLYDNGKQVHFIKYKDFSSIETNTKNGIVPADYQGVKKTSSNIVLDNPINDWFFGTSKCKNKVLFHVDMNFNDPYVCDSVCGKNINRLGIKRRWFANGWHYYLVLTIEGDAPKKINDIERVKNNRVGIDYGTSTIAVASDKTVLLELLAPESIKYEKKIRHLQKVNESRVRKLNPDNYNEDGTVKKGRREWMYSNQIRQDYSIIRQLYRQKSDYITNCHNRIANQIVRNADSIIAEPMKFSKLQAKSKTLERKEVSEVVKNKKGIEKSVHKYKKRKRYGHSIGNHSPGLLQTIVKGKALKYKIPYLEIDIYQYKATQVNPVTGEYKKIGRDERWKVIDGKQVQRDLCSAYSISCAKENRTEIDLIKSKKGFESFKKEHDKYLNYLKSQNISNKGTLGFKKIYNSRHLERLDS